MKKYHQFSPLDWSRFFSGQYCNKYNKSLYFCYNLFGLSFDTIKEFNNSFINTFLFNENLPELTEHLFVVFDIAKIKNKTKLFSKMANNLYGHYIIDTKVVFVYKIPDEFIKDLKLIKESKYSKVSKEAKKVILKDNTEFITVEVKNSNLLNSEIKYRNGFHIAFLPKKQELDSICTELNTTVSINETVSLLDKDKETIEKCLKDINFIIEVFNEPTIVSKE